MQYDIVLLGLIPRHIFQILLLPPHFLPSLGVPRDTAAVLPGRPPFAMIPSPTQTMKSRNATQKNIVFLFTGLVVVIMMFVLYSRGQGVVSGVRDHAPGSVYNTASLSASGTGFVPFAIGDNVGRQHESDFVVTRVPELPAFLRSWTDHALFDRLFYVDEKQGHLSVPDTFQQKVKDMFKSYPGGSESLHFVEHQTIITIRNRITHEHSLFNRIRRYRPGYRETLTEQELESLEKLIADSSGDGCDFCHPERTAVDLFGQLQGEHCYVAANVAKYEKWHSLLISKEHSPIRFTLPAIKDYMKTAGRYFAEVHKKDPTAVAPHLMWDATGRASASQVHQHMQMSINTHYYQRAEVLREQVLRYGETFGANYFADMITVHDKLGLAIRRGQAALLVHLTPIKEREILVIGDSSSVAFAELLFAGLRSLIDGAGTRSFSAAIVFEHLENRSMMPAVARIIDRGAPGDVRNDVGAMEFFGSNNVGMVCSGGHE